MESEKDFLRNSKQTKPARNFDGNSYKKKKPKRRIFDECSVLNDPYRWREKILEVIPEQKYHIFERIFNLPPTQHILGPDRDYSLYDINPLKKGRKNVSSTSTKTISFDESSISFVQFPIKTSTTSSTLKRSASTVEKSDITKTYSERSVDSRVLSTRPFKSTCRTLKWKLAALKALKSESDFDDLFVNPPTRPPTPPKDILKDARSPYQKFLTKSDEEVASNWKKKEKEITINDLNVEEQATLASNMLAKNFIRWMRNEAGFTESALTKSMLKHMFQVDLKDQVLRTMKVEMKELAAVPNTVAQYYNVPDLNYRSALHKQIVWDHLFEKIPVKKVGFGSGFKKKFKKPKTSVKEKWFSEEVVPSDLQSGALLWHDLVGTPVLEKFCEWLLENPQYSRPKYLVTSGYLKNVAKNLKEKTGTCCFQRLAARRKNQYKLNTDKLWSKIKKLNKKLQVLFSDESEIEEEMGEEEEIIEKEEKSDIDILQYLGSEN